MSFMNSSGFSRCLLFLAISLTFLLTACEESPTRDKSEISGGTMGTYYRIAIISSSLLDLEDIKSDIEAILDDINSQMSTYITDSQISRFNQYQQNDWFNVSQDLASVSQKALEVFTQTEGLFDPTIGPLVNLWSFGSQNVPLKVPSPAQLKQVKRFIGADQLQVQADPPALKKISAHLRLDLSAIAKGFAVDKIAHKLIELGHEDFLIDIGGELRSKGKNLDSEPWQIGIEKPDSASPQSVYKLIAISDKSIATSGSYRNYFEQDGVRYSHIINPHTGYPIEHKLVSVSVISDDCITADVYATALMVLGPNKGYDFALQYGLAVYMIEKKGDELISRFTPQMKPFLE